jgi:peptidoglycan hydrolase-like protein with peptidoglycan-binding domain
LFVLALAGAGFAANSTPKPTGRKSAPARVSAAKRKVIKPAAKRPGAKAGAVRTAAAARKSKSKKPVRTRTARRVYQTAPAPERYQEIQVALAARGYFTGQPDGAWGPDSIEALKRFQKDQNLAPSGKLNSVSLIALGLGPKRNLAAGAGPDPNTLPRPQDENRRSQGSQRP